MRSTWQKTLACACAVGGCYFSTSLATAQGYGAVGSLGGYGAASSYISSSMSSGGSMVIPYGGMFEGFMPSRMGGGAALAFRPRSTANMGSSRTSFSLSPMSGGGMSSMSGGMGRGLGSRIRSTATFAPLGGGAGPGGGMGRMSGMGRPGVMPPRIGYPFREPPSLVSPSTTTTGMTM